MLPSKNLRELVIKNCRMLEVIIVSEEEEEEKAVNEIAAKSTSSTEDHILVFPRLGSLELENLVNLFSFYSKYRRRRSEGAQIEWCDRQVGFPELKELYLFNNYTNPRHFSRLWHGLANNLSLEYLILRHGGLPPHLLRRLQIVDRLDVRDSDEVIEGLVHVGEGRQYDQEWRLTEVRQIELHDLPQLTCLWNKDPRGIFLDLRNLKFVEIEKCPLLRSLFAPSVAMALEQLETLWLESCDMMEEVIATVDGDDGLSGHADKDNAADDIIGFPKLWRLGLMYLPNLTSFSKAYHYNTINLPSLREVILTGCPKLRTFTSGLVNMPQEIVLKTSYDEPSLHIEDLNKYLEESYRLLEGGKNENEDAGIDTEGQSFISEIVQ